MQSDNDNLPVLERIDNFLGYLDSLGGAESTPYTKEEVDEILALEGEKAKENYQQAIEDFRLNDSLIESGPSSKRFLVYWGYPGAGKSFMAKKLMERFGNEEDCLPFYVIDKDEHRKLFPNLFSHLKKGHIDECEKFAGVTIDYVRKVLSLQLQSGSKSILSVGSMGAGSEFKDNALMAMAYGYKPCAVYMAVNPDVAFFSSVFRSAELYNLIIFENEELYPRLVAPAYFSRVVKGLPDMIRKIDSFQRENVGDVDLLVLNRADELLYDSRKPHQLNVLDVIKMEENRPLSEKEKMILNMQLSKVERNLKHRVENNVYPPQKSEIEMIKTAVLGIRKLLDTGGRGGLGRADGGNSLDSFYGFRQCISR